LLGGRLCLDFVNTIEGRIGLDPEDFLRGCADVLHWGEHAGLLTAAQVSMHSREAAKKPGAAAACLANAISLRELLYRIFLALAREAQPTADDLERLKRVYLDALAQAELSPEQQGFRWEWPAKAAGLEAILRYVARDAVELLCSPDVRRIKQCPGAGDCGWLFLDASKNRSRRWCSMEGCGSRVKMRRQYARRRDSAP
jgi:predicted RNA-binding Zn ribbon-like protein